MQMKKDIREEKGSMAVYVTVVLLSYITILGVLFTSSVSNRKIQLQTLAKIKESYENVYNDIETTYQEQLFNYEKTLPKVTISLQSSAMVNETIQVNVKIESARNIDFTKCKYVFNQIGGKIGTEIENYTGGNIETASVNIPLVVTAEGTYYLHILATDEAGNSNETISTPINITASSET